MLEFFVNKSVVIKDLVRIGQNRKAESEDVQRPLSFLIKLDSVWGRRLALPSKRKLRVEQLF